MKQIYFIYCLLLSQIFTAQFNIIKVDTLKDAEFGNLEKNSFYQVDDASKLRYFIKKSDKNYKIVYTFTDWCKPCREKFPKILDFEKEYKNNLDVFYLTDIYRDSSYKSTDNYLKSIGCLSPIFNITDNGKNKNKKGKYEYFVYNAEKKKETKEDRYTHFTQNLAPKHWYYGYSLVVLYDGNDEVVYASTYNETHQQVYDKIKSILNK